MSSHEVCHVRQKVYQIIKEMSFGDLSLVKVCLLDIGHSVGDTCAFSIIVAKILVAEITKWSFLIIFLEYFILLKLL